jgi:hypothetical protein
LHRVPFHGFALPDVFDPSLLYVRPRLGNVIRILAHPSSGST